MGAEGPVCCQRCVAAAAPPAGSAPHQPRQPMLFQACMRWQQCFALVSGTFARGCKHCNLAFASVPHCRHAPSNLSPGRVLQPHPAHEHAQSSRCADHSKQRKYMDRSVTPARPCSRFTAAWGRASRRRAMAPAPRGPTQPPVLHLDCPGRCRCLRCGCHRCRPRCRHWLAAAPAGCAGRSFPGLCPASSASPLHAEGRGEPPVASVVSQGGNNNGEAAAACFEWQPGCCYRCGFQRSALASPTSCCAAATEGYTTRCKSACKPHL